MGDCKTAPWAWCPFAALVGLWVLQQEQQYVGGEKAAPKHAGTFGVCIWSFSSGRRLAGEVELYWHFMR